MSFQWTLVAGFLYFEVGFVVLLCLPILSATRWSRIFNSKLLSWLATNANYYFGILLSVLVILFADAVNQMRKHGEDVGLADHSASANLATQTYHTMMKFRAQRNFYITGFAILLILVLRRMISALCEQANMEARLSAALQQAKSASDQAERFMNEAEKLKKAARGEEENEEKELKAKLEERNNALVEELNEAQRGLCWLLLIKLSITA
jgi:B-cell receptor-associated protein 31